MKTTLERWAARRQKAVQAINAFAGDLYRNLREQPGNLFVSPFSIHSILDLALYGAVGETAAELARVLHWNLPHENGSRAAVGDFPKSNPPPEISIANSIWMQQEIALHASFRNALADSGAEIFPADFTRDPEASRRLINRWIAEKTRERITDLVPTGAVTSLTRFLLANAIYFKADWRDKFDRDQTAQAPFHLADGSTLLVEMMHQVMRAAAMDEERFVGVRLPYHSHDCVMQILVPRDINDLDWLELEILAKGPAAWSSLRQHREVKLSLPRFSIETTVLLGQVLRSMGLSTAFDPNTADFRGISAEKFGITELVHQTMLKVDEDGTEAAGATAMMLSTGAESNYEILEVNVDRPFLLTIEYAPMMDADHAVILFMGRVMQPDGVATQQAHGTFLTDSDDGVIVEFLKSNCFRIRLRDGREIDAVMIDDLIPLGREAHLRLESLVVGLEYREVGMPRIIRARYK